MRLLDNRNILNIDLKFYEYENFILVNASEIAKIINNKNVSQMLKNVDNDEKILVTTARKNGGFLNQWYLTEDGIYEVLMLSKSEIAKRFKKEIKKILKEVRTKNFYINIKNTDSLETIKDKLLSVIDNLNQELEHKKREILNFENYLKEDSELSTISFLANKYDVSVDKFLEILKENHFLYKKGKNYFLYREHKYKNYIKYYKVKNKYIIKFTNKAEILINNFFIK